MTRSYAVALFRGTQRVPEAALFACGSMVLADRSVCGFSARSAEKPHTIEMGSTALPKAEHANCVHPKIYNTMLPFVLSEVEGQANMWRADGDPTPRA